MASYLSKGILCNEALSPAFTTAWDNWLQGAMETSKALLGEAWLNVYLVSPLWRFVLAPACLVERPVAGVMMPSVDSVGRYFPLVIAAEMDGCQAPLLLAGLRQDWFEQAEELALTGLGPDFALTRFEQQLEALPIDPPVTCKFLRCRRNGGDWAFVPR